jgi:hypothetical protein
MERKSVSFVWLLIGFILLVVLSGCFLRVTITSPTIALITPADHTLELPLVLLLTWEATPGTAQNNKTIVTITGYRVYFARSDETYGDPENTADKQLQKTGLALNTQYKWKVIVVQSDGQTTESAEQTFKTQVLHYASPTIALISPANGATTQATELTLTWIATPGDQTNVGERDATVDEYLIYFATSTAVFGTPENTTATQYPLSSLAYGTTYKWQVVAIQSDGKYATSTEQNFTTFAALYAAPAIALATPENGATGQATELTLTWVATPGAQTNVGVRDASITEYLVYFGLQGSGYGNPVNVTSNQQQKTNLTYGQTYKWQVVAIQSDGQRVTSSERTFTTADRLYGAPEIALTAPANGATDRNIRVTISWEATPGYQTNTGERAASFKEFWIYHAKTGEIFPLPVTAANNSYELTNLATNTEYTFKVRAIQSDWKTVETPEATFMTRSGPIVRYNEEGHYQKSYHKLSDAISEANGKDIIEVDGGTLLNNETKQVTIAGKEVTIRSSDETPFTIDMTGKNDRVFEITEGASVTMCRLVITGGAKGSNGGGVYLAVGSKLTTRHATIVSNATFGTDHHGGGVCIENGFFVAESTLIASNTAASCGGGVLLDGGGTFTATDTTIASNTAAAAGGGVYVNSGNFNANSVTIRGNLAAEGQGGGIIGRPGQGWINTSGIRWAENNKSNAFSVSATGVIHDDPQNYPNDPVQVFDNTAPTDTGTNQLGFH